MVKAGLACHPRRSTTTLIARPEPGPCNDTIIVELPAGDSGVGPTRPAPMGVAPEAPRGWSWAEGRLPLGSFPPPTCRASPSRVCPVPPGSAPLRNHGTGRGWRDILRSAARRIGDDVPVADRAPGSGRYAHREREQRWRIEAVPAAAERTAEIYDWYIVDTRLRLRSVDDGRSQVFKLAQKVRTDPGAPETVSLTNMYLDRGEYEIVRQLPGRELHKTRWHVMHEKRRIAVDEFHGRLRGLVLAEVELQPEEERLALPSFATEDVTNDDRFSGGSLAFMSDERLHSLRGLTGPE